MDPSEEFVGERPPLPSRTTLHLPGLNGLRSIAVLAVVVSHTTLALNEFGLDNRIFGTDADGKAKGLALARHGVTIFFALSGFLITYLLLEEQKVTAQKTGVASIGVRAFYVRRMLRIWPLYYLYFAATLATLAAYGMAYDHKAIVYYVLLAANIPFIAGNPIPNVVHYWSLGVEEQFYLFFPHLAKFPPRRILQIALGLIVVLLGIKAGAWIVDRKFGMPLPYLAIGVTRFHNMLVGVAGAVWYHSQNKKFLSVVTHRLVQVASWGAILLIATNRFHFASVIDGEIVSLVALFLIIGQVTRTNMLIDLENQFCDFVGKISYGMYVIHPLIIFYIVRLLHGASLKGIQGYLAVYSVILGLTVGLAYLSYNYVEKPFLKWKARFTTVHSASSRQ